MTNITIQGPALHNLPWEERPENCSDPVWRYSGNPILTSDAIPRSNSIFNSAVVPFNGQFAGVFRCDNRERIPKLHTGFSKDGIRWTLTPKPISFSEQPEGIEPFWLGYDPRVCRIGDEYLVTWCNAYQGFPTIGVASTRDFETFVQLEHAFLPYNRNGVLFPRKINGEYVMLSRPSDNGHTPFGDIFLSRSRDLVYWGKHRLVMRKGCGWEDTKIGAGPVPIETSEGWLLFYHGVLKSCNGFVYSFGAALLDLDDPTRVIARGKEYLLAPKAPYERIGDVPNVVFPCATLPDAATGRIALYYGCADTVTGLAFCRVDEVIDAIQRA